MNGLISAGLGCILYGITNVLLSRNFEGVSALTTSTWFSASVFSCCIIAQVICRMTGNTPGSLNVYWPLMFLMAAMYFSADYFYLNAFSQKTHVLSITILATLVPVVAAVITFAIDRNLPNSRHVLAFILALASILVLPH